MPFSSTLAPVPGPSINLCILRIWTKNRDSTSLGNPLVRSSTALLVDTSPPSLRSGELARSDILTTLLFPVTQSEFPTTAITLARSLPPELSKLDICALFHFDDLRGSSSCDRMGKVSGLADSGRRPVDVHGVKCTVLAYESNISVSPRERDGVAVQVQTSTDETIHHHHPGNDIDASAYVQ